MLDKANDSLILINYKASEEVGLQLLDHEQLDSSPTRDENEFISFLNRGMPTIFV